MKRDLALGLAAFALYFAALAYAQHMDERPDPPPPAACVKWKH